MKKKYTFSPYSMCYPNLFAEEAKTLQNVLPKESILEHVGSSAVPGLGGKGIIDIGIGISGDKTRLVISTLEKLGYEFQSRLSTPGRAFLKAQKPDLEEGVRMYHIHVMDPESEQWLDMIFFRDYLRKFPEAMHEYAVIKKQAALESQDQGELYRKCKEPFIQKILKRRNGIPFE